MDNFIVSARKYRPDNFQSVVGQESITTTLKNAIKTNHLAQAYLFCGPRGVGKTTCARIFAKTINCQNLSVNQEACNQCESCISFNQSRSYSIHELDAASNNSVDDIRTLIDQVRIPPQIGNYSIYIIDEVHMLSSQAFNAFLKTLEEPPKHAIFILATTEKHKIIPTILSRCQIFDFHRIRVEDAVKYLEFIAKEENIEYETEGLNIIAQKADGAMRDALSIFDQVVSFSDNKITYKGVIENLNVLDYEYYFRITEAFLKEDIKETLLLFDEILGEGFDAHNFINGLASHFRDLLVCKDVSTLKLLEVGDSIKEKYKTQASRCNNNFLYEALKICSDCDINYRISKNKRLHVEFTLIRLCRIEEEKKNANSVGQKKTSKTEPPNSDHHEKEGVQTGSKSQSRFIDKSPILQTPSIRDALNKSSISSNDNLQQKPQEKTESDKQENPFTDDELKYAFVEFTEKIKKTRPRMYSTLNSTLPQRSDDYKLKIEMQNQTQLDEFNHDIKHQLTSFLKSMLKNSLIEIEPYISEIVENQEQRLYTKEDKFKFLSEKNPNLDKLKQQFNLDFE